jgi:hypothetical protein
MMAKHKSTAKRTDQRQMERKAQNSAVQRQARVTDKRAINRLRGGKVG